jgi:hypothetical protein
MPGIVIGRELILTGSHDLPGSRSHEVLPRDCPQALDESCGFDVALLLDLVRETRARFLQIIHGHRESLLNWSNREHPFVSLSMRNKRRFADRSVKIFFPAIGNEHPEAAASASGSEGVRPEWLLLQ